MSQSELAQQIDFRQPEISLIEAGSKSIGIQRFWEVCDALDIEPSALFAIAEDEAHPDD